MSVEKSHSIVISADELPSSLSQALGLTSGKQYRLVATIEDLLSDIEQPITSRNDDVIPVVSLQYETPSPDGTNSDDWEAAAAEIKGKK